MRLYVLSYHFASVHAEATEWDSRGRENVSSQPSRVTNLKKTSSEPTNNGRCSIKGEKA
jgi:hypothetical protein